MFNNPDDDCQQHQQDSHHSRTTIQKRKRGCCYSWRFDTVTVTAIVLFRCGATLVFSWPTTTPTVTVNMISSRIPSQATILLKRQEQQQQILGSWKPSRLWAEPVRKERSSAGDSDSDIDSTMTALIGRFRSSGHEHEQERGSLNTLESLDRLEQENARLKERLKDLEQENQMLHYEVASRIVLETFEGEGKMWRLAQQKDAQHKYEYYDDRITKNNDPPSQSLKWTGEEIMSEYKNSFKYDNNDVVGMWCDELADDGACPVEPLVSFQEALRDRAYWLVGLLVLQSGSGIILARNEDLLANHPVIVYFLTMLVGAGGNAGNQASVRVIRGLAIGTLNENTQGQFLMRELKMAMALSGILALAGFLRAAVFRTPISETLAVTAALAMIVFSSVCLGAVLPLIMKKLQIDPAHSSTTIQVLMDILGVVLAVVVSSLLLDSPMGQLLISKLGG